MSELSRLRVSERYGACDDELTRSGLASLAVCFMFFPFVLPVLPARAACFYYTTNGFHYKVFPENGKFYNTLYKKALEYCRRL